MIDRINRLENEPNKAFLLLLQYCSLGVDRSLAKLAEISGKSLSRLKQLSVSYSWSTRTTKFDNEQIKQQVEQEIKEQKVQYLTQIKGHRQRRIDLSIGLAQSVQTLLLKLNNNIDLLSDSDLQLNPLEISSAIKNIAAIAKVAMDSESHALGIRELLFTIDPASHSLEDNKE